MTHIGLIYCAYSTREYLAQSLAPWITLRRMGQIKITICAVNVLFEGFEGKDDGTRELLRGYVDRGEIDRLVDGPDNIPETTARGMALTYLKGRGVDMVIQWDSDEMTDIPSIERALKFMEDNVFTVWFRFSYANLVFDEHTRLAEPFTPPRAFRVEPDGWYKAHSFGGDNDIWYGGTITRDIIPPDRFASMTIPEHVFCPRHFSWLNNERSRAKVAYQQRRWNHCSFAWDDSKGGLIFNPALPPPKVVREET